MQADRRAAAILVLLWTTPVAFAVLSEAVGQQCGPLPLLALLAWAVRESFRAPQGATAGSQVEEARPGVAQQFPLDAEGRARVGPALPARMQRMLLPILMTTLTTVLGLLPMALGIGEGAEIRAAMAVAVIGGLTLSTLLTLVVIPAFYAAVDRRP